MRNNNWYQFFLPNSVWTRESLNHLRFIVYFYGVWVWLCSCTMWLCEDVIWCVKIKTRTNYHYNCLKCRLAKPTVEFRSARYIYSWLSNVYLTKYNPKLSFSIQSVRCTGLRFLIFEILDSYPIDFRQFPHRSDIWES